MHQLKCKCLVKTIIVHCKGTLIALFKFTLKIRTEYKFSLKYDILLRECFVFIELA